MHRLASDSRLLTSPVPGLPSSISLADGFRYLRTAQTPPVAANAVSRRRNRFEMPGIGAGAVAAQRVKLEIFGDGAVPALKCPPMSGDDLARPCVEQAVADVAQLGLPHPAARCPVAADLLSKPLGWVAWLRASRAHYAPFAGFSAVTLGAATGSPRLARPLIAHPPPASTPCTSTVSPSSTTRSRSGTSS